MTLSWGRIRSLISNMMVRPDDPMATLDHVSVDDIDRSIVIIRSGSQLSTRDIDEPGVRLEDLLGDRHFVGCNRLDETIEMIKAGCGIAFALMPLEMETPGLARVPLDVFGVEDLGFAYLKQHETEDLLALIDVLCEVYRDGDLVPQLR